MFSAFMESWNDPHARHAVLVHLPVVFGALGLLPLIALACTGFRSRTLKLVAVVWFLIASGGAALAANSGEDAEKSLKSRLPALTEVEDKAIHEHEELAENGWIWPLIPAALVAITLLPPRGLRIGAGVLAIVAGGGVTGWIALTANAGGKLVYVHGIGVPARVTAPATLPPARAEPTP